MTKVSQRIERTNPILDDFFGGHIFWNNHPHSPRRPLVRRPRMVFYHCIYCSYITWDLVHNHKTRKQIEYIR